MKKILYIMNVEWGWIKQRPHFIAEGLSEKYDVDIVYKYRYNRSEMQSNESNNINLCPIYTIPRIGRYKRLKRINDILYLKKIKKKIRKGNYDFIYLTYPLQIKAIPNDYMGKILYDCMDNHVYFENDARVRKEISKCEMNLVSKAYKILVSSDKLKSIIVKEYGSSFSNNIVIVRNGFDGSIIYNIKDDYKHSNNFTLAYIGTISSWFNIDYIVKSLNDIRCLKYILIGPSVIDIPQNERIEYKGVVEHSQLYNEIKDADGLIMPFVVNEIVEAVDPVKFYEYINYNKNIISVYYDEIKRYDNFVDFYTSYNEYIGCINNLIKSSKVKFSNEDRITFLNMNSWNNRVQQVCNIIDGVEE